MHEQGRACLYRSKDATGRSGGACIIVHTGGVRTPCTAVHRAGKTRLRRRRVATIGLVPARWGSNAGRTSGTPVSRGGAPRGHGESFPPPPPPPPRDMRTLSLSLYLVYTVPFPWSIKGKGRTPALGVPKRTNSGQTQDDTQTTHTHTHTLRFRSHEHPADRTKTRTHTSLQRLGTLLPLSPVCAPYFNMCKIHQLPRTGCKDIPPRLV